MSLGGPNQDVLTGRVPLRYSPIPGLSNASWIVNRKYDEDYVRKALVVDPQKSGFENFGNFVKKFTKNPSKDDMSKAVSLLRTGTASGV